jgi:pantoate--beta-alanine ligase
MGYLHEGHLSLVRASKSNVPVQLPAFSSTPLNSVQKKTLSKYPRDLARDLACWKPKASIWCGRQMNGHVPPWFSNLGDRRRSDQPLEGKQRPGHFRGVSPRLSQNFSTACAHKKPIWTKGRAAGSCHSADDARFSYPIDIVICPIVREPDGLAMSSRNVYLNPQERQAALVLESGPVCRTAGLLETENAMPGTCEK